MAPLVEVRPICSCGWLGTTCRNLADAEIEAERHELNAGLAQFDVEEQRPL